MVTPKIELPFNQHSFYGKSPSSKVTDKVHSRSPYSKSAPPRTTESTATPPRVYDLTRRTPPPRQLKQPSITSLFQRQSSKKKKNRSHKILRTSSTSSESSPKPSEEATKNTSLESPPSGVVDVRPNSPPRISGTPPIHSRLGRPVPFLPPEEKDVNSFGTRLVDEGTPYPSSVNSSIPTTKVESLPDLVTAAHASFPSYAPISPLNNPTFPVNAPSPLAYSFSPATSSLNFRRSPVQSSCLRPDSPTPFNFATNIPRPLSGLYVPDSPTHQPTSFRHNPNLPKYVPASPEHLSRSVRSPTFVRRPQMSETHAPLSLAGHPRSSESPTFYPFSPMYWDLSPGYQPPTTT